MNLTKHKTLLPATPLGPLQRATQRLLQLASTSYSGTNNCVKIAATVALHVARSIVSIPGILCNCATRDSRAVSSTQDTTMIENAKNINAADYRTIPEWRQSCLTAFIISASERRREVNEDFDLLRSPECQKSDRGVVDEVEIEAILIRDTRHLTLFRRTFLSDDNDFLLRVSEGTRSRETQITEGFERDSASTIGRAVAFLAHGARCDSRSIDEEATLRFSKISKHDIFELRWLPFLSTLSALRLSHNERNKEYDKGIRNKAYCISL
ncbi:hypothetical protein DBV15_03258 [Temnothorax longispinosus]|uniref:Uncharacterized protein n=1 Tax=Temnothorax longispinosus TaxID=300112 RepID=A0A4S2JS77_9HYME|nr:hypothetical protein DBV15_03258 [Temnothorax longispinosus]